MELLLHSQQQNSKFETVKFKYLTTVIPNLWIRRTSKTLRVSMSRRLHLDHWLSRVMQRHKVHPLSSSRSRLNLSIRWSMRSLLLRHATMIRRQTIRKFQFSAKKFNTNKWISYSSWLTLRGPMKALQISLYCLLVAASATNWWWLSLDTEVTAAAIRPKSTVGR